MIKSARRPRTTVCALIAAPAVSSDRSTSSDPPTAAAWSAVQPASFAALTSAPARRIAATAASRPACAATMSALFPPWRRD